MPIYEYTCTKCGKDFEELVFGDDLPARPHCGAAEHPQADVPLRSLQRRQRRR